MNLLKLEYTGSVISQATSVYNFDLWLAENKRKSFITIHYYLLVTMVSVKFRITRIKLKVQIVSYKL